MVDTREELIVFICEENAKKIVTLFQDIFQ